jgi:ABC-type multidrug transport system ATPase subunit
MDKQNMIEIKNLDHHYPDGTHALKGINLTIQKGEFLLICGPNGSGKTTLIRKSVV